jgi:ubiquinone/menaquinone biosynthesis C-methylase UbiE
MKFGAEKGIGFDIAENMVAWANGIARETNMKCSFIATNILEIDESYHNSFDFILITIGAITWFEDLRALFRKVFLCMKENGVLIINDMHPVTNMLAFMGEDNFDEKVPNKMINSYFKQDPWVENHGMGYMCQEAYDSKTFYSFSHTFSSVFNSVILNGLTLIRLREFQHDISNSLAHLENQGIPLSYILVARK